ncbi:nuclear factor 7, brain-like [Aplochiton taeniatus]
MSAPCNLQSEDPFQCSICLDVFKDPVTIPCGHTYCRSCIKTHWDGKDVTRCPLCQETFNMRPELKVNIGLREALKSYMKLKKVRDEMKEEIQERLRNLSDIRVSAELTKRNTLSERSDSLQFIHDVRSVLKRRLVELDQLEKQQEAAENMTVDVTLDPDTAHPSLILSEDGKQVRLGDGRQNLPDNPKRFDLHAYVLGREGFSSGRFYYEVQVKDKILWDLGVARESVNRNGEITLRPEDGYWTVWLIDGNYIALEDPPIKLSISPPPQKVGVFVDYAGGQVSFYDVDNRSHIYSYTGQAFTETLYPYFSPSINMDGGNSAPLVITPVSHED